MLRLRRLLRSGHRSDRGDIIVTPTIIVLGVALTLLTAGLTYVAARAVAPGVDNARQGVTIDDEGNVVEGGVGVIPVPTPTPTEKPTEEPQAPAPVVRRTQAPAFNPTPTPFVHVATDDPHETEEPHETEDPVETHDPDDDDTQHPN